MDFKSTLKLFKVLAKEEPSLKVILILFCGVSAKKSIKNSKMQCTFDLVTLLVSTKIVNKSHNVTKHIDFM